MISELEIQMQRLPSMSRPFAALTPAHLFG
jgi:hypothetical protein